MLVSKENFPKVQQWVYSNGMSSHGVTPVLEYMEHDDSFFIELRFLKPHSSSSSVEMHMLADESDTIEGEFEEFIKSLKES